MKSVSVVLLLAFAAAFAVQSPTRVFAESAEEAKLDLHAAMNLLKSKAAALGTPNVKGEFKSCRISNSTGSPTLSEIRSLVVARG